MWSESPVLSQLTNSIFKSVYGFECAYSLRVGTKFGAYLFFSEFSERPSK